MKKTILIIILALAVGMAGCTEKTQTAAASTSTTEATTTVAVASGEGNADVSAEASTESTSEATAAASTEATTSETAKEKTMVLKIGETQVPVTWEENASVAELRELAADGIRIDMSMYGGFEQVGPIGRSITSDDAQTTTSSGDIVLYSSNQIVIFYGSNSWSYTRLGKISLSEAEMTDLLSNGDVSITLTME